MVHLARAAACSLTDLGWEASMCGQRQLDLPILILLLLLFVPFSLVACVALEIATERTPTPGGAITPTARTPATENALPTPFRYRYNRL